MCNAVNNYSHTPAFLSSDVSCPGAGQEVLLDGRSVRRQSGTRQPDFLNRFPFCWRARSTEYEAHATDSGIDIRLGGRTIWGIRADDIF